jgi:uncharacterized metal-binding protein
MSDGNVHEKFGIAATIGAGVAIAIVTIPVNGFMFAIGGIFGTLYLSPDLDCRGARRAKSWHRWRRLGLGWYWSLYARTIPHHRHWLSHSPVIATVYRLVWLLAPVLILTVATGHPFNLLSIFAVIYGLAGVEFSNLVHLRLDQ